MSVPNLAFTDAPGRVWRVGFQPDMWGWTPWQYATDAGLFDGRWDDQLGQFRSLYTSSSLLGCFLELLAKLQPTASLIAALDEVEDDDESIGRHHEGPHGAVGHTWFEGRLFGDADQTGRYCFITHSDSLAALKTGYHFERHGIALVDVDAALLKDARDREVTRSIAHWIYDLRNPDGTELVDGIEFRSRHGDEIHMWAVFERADDDQHSRCLSPVTQPMPVTPDTPEFVEALRRLGLSVDEVY